MGVARSWPARLQKEFLKGTYIKPFAYAVEIRVALQFEVLLEFLEEHGGVMW